ncbi:MAG: DNA mismatch repair protein MutS [Acidobacteria bacterium]|nr:DNA mismatch repair protein MutS [Acidobacteriota bacterium]
MPDPRSSYRARLDKLTAELQLLDIRERSLVWTRLALFILFVVVAWMAFVEGLLNGWLSVIPLLAFIVAIVIHARLIRRKRIVERRARFCSLGIARIDRNWNEIPEIESEIPEDHLYADDLDIAGTGSVVSLISTARTVAGRTTLTRWLLEPASRTDILERQTASRELQDRSELREDLFSIVGPDVAEIGPDAFADAAADSTDPGPAPVALRVAALLFAATNVITLLGWLAADLPRSWFLASVLASAATAWLSRRYRTSLSGIEPISDSLMLLETLLERIEHELFDDPALARIHETLIGGEEAAARGIRKLRKLVTLLDSRRNQIFYPIALLLLWDTNLSFAIGAWRRKYGSHAGEWVEALGELEALLSFGSFAWENPDYVFPEIVDSSRPLFDATAAGHPLIPPVELVRNDFRLDSNLELLVISGSNMSGKSTFLRTVGVNTVLGLAGAPVCAASLRLSEMRLGASIQVRDSLLERRSRFYAEILRLRDIVREAESSERPFLFLLDEILHGTNSHDRRIGAEAIVRSLLARGASGLVTTHDLALSKIAESIPTAANVHFEDRIENGEMIFDYGMKPGVVERSNAVELMRQIGLDV